MVVFHEYIPTDKKMIQDYVDRRMLQASSNTSLYIRRENPKFSQGYVRTNRKSLTEAISNITKDTYDELRQQESMEAKIMEVQKQIEKMELIGKKFEPETEPKVQRAQKGPKIDKNELFEETVKKLTDPSTTSNEPGTSKAEPRVSILKRVSKLEESDSEASDYKPPVIKTTKAHMLKTKYNEEKRKSSLLEPPRFLKKTSKTVSKPRGQSIVSFDIPKKIDTKNTTKEVKKILADAKEKHKARNSVTSNIPVNVVDLFLL